MRKLNVKLTMIIVLILSFLSMSTHCHCQNDQHGWPIGPTNVEHPIGQSFGEFQDYGNCPDPLHCVYQHSGIDILGTPKYDSNDSVDPAAPWVFVTVDGIVTEIDGTCDQTEDSSSYYTSVQAEDGLVYRYGHLQRCSYDPDYLLAIANNGKKVKAGMPIAQLVRWYVCDYHHLHYDLQKNGVFVNPLKNMTPHGDRELPEIGGIFIAQNNSDPWVEIKDKNSEGYIVVSGQVDIVAQIRDRDSAGSNHPSTKRLWVHNILWRACPESNRNCTWNSTYTFDEMPMSWNTKANNPCSSAYFSVSGSWVSIDNYCQDTGPYAYAVITSFVGGKSEPDKAGSWDTKAIPDGNYLVDVKAIDFAGNETTLTIKVCVNNGGPPSSPGDLRIPGS